MMTFLMDEGARPTPKDMKLWVDVLRFIKQGAKGGALGFFTYMELSACLLHLSLPHLESMTHLIPFSTSHLARSFPSVPTRQAALVSLPLYTVPLLLICLSATGFFSSCKDGVFTPNVSTRCQEASYGHDRSQGVIHDPDTAQMSQY